MKKICHNTRAAIYEDGENWVLKVENKKDLYISKIEQPLLPLSSVVKFEMVEDDANMLNKLRSIVLNK
jgi:hypothetical protein